MRHTIIGYILILALLGAPLAGDAQQGGKVPRIGYLGDLPGPHAEALRQALHDIGYMEGQHLVIEYRWGEGKSERLPALRVQIPTPNTTWLSDSIREILGVKKH